MSSQEDKRPPEFTAPIKALPSKLKAIKQLQLKGEDSFEHKHTLTYTAPKTLTLTSRDSYGKERFYYHTDSRTSISRVSGKRSRRDKSGTLPFSDFEIPRLVAILLGQSTLARYGIPHEGDFARSYEVSEKVKQKRPVLQLSYRGADSIGRDQTGELTIDQKTGLPLGFDEYQSGNSPRDDAEYSFWESWNVVSIR